MATVRELVVKWGFDVNTKPIDDLNKTIKQTSVSVAAVGAAVAAAGATLFGFAKFTADAGDEALKTSQKLGIGVESLQKLGFAAKLANIDSHEFAMSLNFLNRNAVEALKGNKDTAAAFKALGVNVRDANGQIKPADMLFKQIAGNFNKLPQGAVRSAVAMQLFGRSGANLIPLLQKGNAELDDAAAKAERFGIVLTQAQAEAGEKFNDTLTESQAVLAGLRNMIGNELIPVLTEALGEFNEFIVANRDDLASGIRAVTDAMRSFLSITFKVGKQLVTSLKGILRIFGGFENVVRVLGVVSAIFAGGALLSAIGAVTTAVIGLAGAFTLANAAALLIPIAIGAAVVAVGLIIEDIVAFFQGRESVTGLIVEKIKEAFSQLVEFFVGVKNYIVSIIESIGAVVLSVLNPVINAIRTVGGLVSSFGGSALSKLGSLFGLGAGPSSGAEAASASNSATINAPISVTTGSNMTPSQQIGAVSSGISDGLAPLLRGAGRTFTPAEAY